jgi:Flp pilus assembly protein TadG
MRRRDKQRGATTVEFVLTLPLMIVLLFGAIDGGRMVISRCMVSYAAIVAARTASVRQTATLTAVKNAAVNAAPLLSLTTSNVNVYINGNTTAVANDTAYAAARPPSGGQTVQVDVSYTFTPLTGTLVKFGSKSMTGTSQTVFE